jgi:hypothetical protein
MKLKKLLLPTLVSAAALGSAPLAHAQFTGYTPGDTTLVLWANGYDSINFDIGAESQFSPSSIFTVSDFSASVVESALGVSTLDGVNFNIGSSTGGGSTPYVTDTVNPNYLTTAGRNNVGAGLNNYAGGSSGVFNGNSGPNNYNIYPDTSSVAYDYQSSLSKEQAWYTSGLVTGSVYTTVPGSVGGDTSGLASIDFYAIGVDTSTLLGDFTLNDTGTLTWNGADAAVPESSTWGILSGFGLLAAVLRGRLAQQSV